MKQIENKEPLIKNDGEANEKKHTNENEHMFLKNIYKGIFW